MVNINQAAQYLLNLNPERNLARQAFYHYLKNFYSLEEEFRQEMIDSFYDRAMGYNYWQDNCATLGETVQKDLISMASTLPVSFDVRDVLHAHEVQWLTLTHPRDIEALVESQLKSRSEAYEWHKSYRVSKNHILCLLGKSDGQLRVEVRNHLVVVENGQLVPVRPITQLNYDASLELSSEHDQILTDTELSCLKFRFSQKGYEGSRLTGHTFQKTKFLSGSINQYPELFYSLKRLERYFINPHTDPFYQELSILMEKALRLVKNRHPDAVIIAEEALKKGRLAIKEVFPNDKELRVLLSHLELQLSGLKWPKEKPGNLPNQIQDPRPERVRDLGKFV